MVNGSGVDEVGEGDDGNRGFGELSIFLKY